MIIKVSKNRYGESIFIPDNCACQTIEVLSGSTPPSISGVLGSYSKMEEKVNGRHFYKSYDGQYAIWWNNKNRPWEKLWVIGYFGDKGTGRGTAWNNHDSSCPIASETVKKWWVFKATSRGNMNPTLYQDFVVRCAEHDEDINRNEFAMASYVFESTIEEQKFENLTKKSVEFLGFYWRIMNKHGKDTMKNFQRRP